MQKLLKKFEKKLGLNWSKTIIVLFWMDRACLKSWRNKVYEKVIKSNKPDFYVIL